MSIEKGVRLNMLNILWSQEFGHSFERCLKLSNEPGETGRIHKAHLQQVMNNAEKQYQARNNPSPPKLI